MIKHTKNFGIYYWDTFVNETLFIEEKDTLAEAIEFVKNMYGNHISKQGADRVDIVDLQGNVIDFYGVT